MMSSNIFLALLMILPKFSKNVKQKIGKKGVKFGRIIKSARNMLDDIIMYQTNPCRVLQNLWSNKKLIFGTIFKFQNIVCWVGKDSKFVFFKNWAWVRLWQKGTKVQRYQQEGVQIGLKFTTYFRLINRSITTYSRRNNLKNFSGDSQTMTIYSIFLLPIVALLTNLVLF